MSGVIVVDAGRSRSTNLGRDAYILIIALDIIIIIRSSINCPTVICLPTMCYFSREATSEIYSPRVYSLSYWLSDLLFTTFIFSLLFQKPKNTLLHFFFTYFILCFCEIYLPKLLQTNLSFSRGGIDNPSYASGCKYLFFVSRYRLHSVAWSPTGSITLVSSLREIPTVAVLHHPFLFGEILT